MGDEEMVPVEVVGVRQHLVDDEIVVLLLDPAAELFVPILIGPRRRARSRPRRPASSRRGR